MEKFAERFCIDNPRDFSTADGAYLLSFAIIMLNTDAHNPMADAHMSRDDFVMMCQTQVDLQTPLCAAFANQLPQDDMLVQFLWIHPFAYQIQEAQCQ